MSFPRKPSGITLEILRATKLKIEGHVWSLCGHWFRSKNIDTAVRILAPLQSDSTLTMTQSTSVNDTPFGRTAPVNLHQTRHGLSLASKEFSSPEMKETS